MTVPPRVCLRIDIWHNILWSQYKGEVFSSLYKINDDRQFDLRFFQIAETDGNRVALGSVDLARHRYPFDLLFKGSYDYIGFLARLWAIAVRTMRSHADLTIITGYEKAEGWMQLLIVRLKRGKVAVFCDSTINDQVQKPLRSILKKIFFTSVDGIFGYGERSRDYVMHYGAGVDKIFYGCQAAALPFGYTPEKALAARLEFAPTRDAPRFLYIGRLSPEKGLGTLLDAFAIVQQQHPSPTLVLIGHGPEQPDLEKHAHRLGLKDAIVFAGSKSGDALYHEYARATALILPSTSEPWGLVVNEALSYGCPVIVSDMCGCVPELVIDGKTGFVHKSGDSKDLAEKMIAAISRFSTIEKSAQDGIGLMKRYTPDKAAAQILHGCRIILSVGAPS